VSALDLLANGFTRLPAIIDRAMSGLDAQQLATRPAAGANTIAWLAWHTARGQDAWVSDLEGTDEIWIADAWQTKFGLTFAPQENGFGMSDDDAGRVIASAQLLTDYLVAVTTQTLAYLSTLTNDSLSDIVDSVRQPVITRGVQLLSILDDGLQHAGQASYARGMLDRQRSSS
jgi:uncharacterized damage-inducible protein DinB